MAYKSAPKNIARHEIDQQTGEINYIKKEFNDDFFFRKTRAISITAQHLDMVSSGGIVVVDIRHRGVVVSASKQTIKNNSKIFTFNKEVKYYLTVDKWDVLSGDAEWVHGLPI